MIPSDCVLNISTEAMSAGRGPRRITVDESNSCGTGSASAKPTHAGRTHDYAH